MAYGLVFLVPYKPIALLKGSVCDSAETLLTFQLNRQSNYTPPFRAPEATCCLERTVYGSVQARTKYEYRSLFQCTY